MAAPGTEKVDGAGASDGEAIASVLVSHFRVEGVGSAEERLVEWVGTAPIEELPRHVETMLPRAMGPRYRDEPSFDRLMTANPRVFWRWTFGG